MISASRVLAAGSSAAPARRKLGMIALDHPLLFGIEPERVGLAHQRVDAGEQIRVGVNVVPVPRHHRRHLALDLLQRIVGMGAGEHMEHVLDPRQRPAAALQRLDRIGETRRRGLGRNRRDFGRVFGAGACVGRAKVFGPDAVERGTPSGVVQGAKNGFSAGWGAVIVPDHSEGMDRGHIGATPPFRRGAPTGRRP